jgi:glucan phosphoethanolaminetransferase (alkaline phosphatase superfamily)
MFQRAQTIWFSLASIILAAMFIFPISNKDVGGILLPTLYTRGFASSWDAGEFITVSITPTYPLLSAHIIVIILCFINIFNYRKRAFQKRFAIVSIALIGGFAFWCSIYAKKLPGGIEGASFGVGAYLPAVAILFIVLAIFGINKDGRLTRSAERLR